MMSILVRDLALGELEVVAEIYGASFDEPYPEPVTASLLRTPGAWCQLAIDTEAGIPLGFVIGRVISDESEILSVGTDPASRRKGVATALMNAASERAISLGAKTLHLEVGEDNPGAVALYKRLEFRATGRRPNYYRRANRRRVAAILMTRHLTTSNKIQ